MSARLGINGRKILVAVDFGTTCSGLAWAQTEKPHVQSIIQQWPESASTDEKVPTRIKYDGESYRWGSLIDDTNTSHQWFKLGLDPLHEQSGPARRSPSTTALPPVSGQECESIVVDYLAALREHADQVLEDTLGAAVLRATPREYIITVPAVWSNRAQETTRSCAERAGMGVGDQIRLISEPEAAGIYALDAMPTLNLSVDDTFVICDAGGGTVDLVSYTVAALEPVPRIYESAPGSGGVCGSMFLNRMFARYLSEWFRNYPPWDADFQTDALTRFENDTKRNFKVEDLSKRYFFSARGLKNNPNLGIENGRFGISGEEIRRIFEPVIEQTVKLVNAQIEATRRNVKAVLLAGGFGRNDYLLARLREAVRDDVEVRKVPNGNTAIVRGALMKALAEETFSLATIKIDSRIARMHYGNCCYTRFDPTLHEDDRKVWDPLFGGYRIRVMNWFIRKGDTIRESVPTLFPFYYDQRVSGGRPGVIDMRIFGDEDPTDAGAPTYKVESVREVVKLKVDLSGIPKELLNQERGEDRMMHYKIDYDIEMTCHSAKIMFALAYGGKRYHTVEKKFV